MSWFNRKPRPRNPPQNLSAKNLTPATERRLREAKERVRTPKEKPDDK
jgi:hypothetical protein